jgi:hypothetical protein
MNYAFFLEISAHAKQMVPVPIVTCGSGRPCLRRECLPEGFGSNPVDRIEIPVKRGGGTDRQGFEGLDRRGFRGHQVRDHAQAGGIPPDHVWQTGVIAGDRYTTEGMAGVNK